MFDVDVPDPAVEEEDQGPTRLRKLADAIVGIMFPERAEFLPLWYFKGLEILVGAAGVRPTLHFRATTSFVVRRKAWDPLATTQTSASSVAEVAVGRDPGSSRLIRWLRDTPASARSRPPPVVIHGDGEEVHAERWEMLLNASEGASRYGMVTFEERFAVTRAYRPPEHRREPLGCRPPPGVAATAGETSITEAVLAGSAGGVLAAAAASVLAAWSGLWLVVVAAVLGAINGLISGYRRIYRWNRRSGWAAFVLDSTWGLVGTALALGVHLANLVVPSDYATACSYRQNRHVYFGGLALRRRYASTRGNVISNADSGRKAVRPSFLSRHEELHVWQSRIFGPLYQFVYAAWTVLGAVVGTALWIFTATERWRSVVETVAYYDNPFEYWAYVHDGRWPPAAANRRFRWPRPRESHGRRPARDAEVSVGCPPQWARQLGAAWEETRAPVEVLADRAFLTERSPSSNILHVVGQPVRTSAGWRLRLDDLESSGPADEAGAPQALFGPGVLREGVVDLVVLQRTPTLADIDFEASDGIREVAAALMAAGERHVVVIPPLPPRRAFDVANALGRWVPRSTTARTWRRLPDLVTSLRLRASRAYVDEATRRLVSPTDRRAGFDICLFSSDPTWVPRRLRPTRRETE